MSKPLLNEESFIASSEQINGYSVFSITSNPLLLGIVTLMPCGSCERSVVSNVSIDTPKYSLYALIVSSLIGRFPVSY